MVALQCLVRGVGATMVEVGGAGDGTGAVICERPGTSQEV